MAGQHRRSGETVDRRGELSRRGGEHAVVDELSHLRRQFGGLGILAVPQHPAGVIAHGVDVVGRQHRRVENHRVHPIRVAHTESRGEIRAVRGAVDHRLVDLRVVEDRGDVVDGLVDGESLGRQVGAAVVVAGHPDTAVVDHDHVEAPGRRVPAQSAIQRHRRRTRARRE